MPKRFLSSARMRLIGICIGTLTAAAPIAAQELDGVDEVLDAQARVEAEAELARLAAEEAREAAASLRAETEAIAARIRALGERIVARENWLDQADERLLALRREIAEAEERLARAAERLSLLGTALQRIRREPTPALLMDPERRRAAARGLAQIGALLRQIDDIKFAARIEIDRIADSGAAARAQEDEVRAERERLRAEIAELEALLEQGQAAESAESERAAAEEARARALAEEAGSLAELAASLAAQEFAASITQPRDVPFSELRGALLRPAAGELSGVRTADGAPGAVMITPPHARVIAPARGVVLYAEEYASHLVVIMRPESGYLIVLNGLGEISTRQGDEIEAGQLIGRMPVGSEGGGRLRRELYIEILSGNTPLDPIPWFETR